MVKKCQVRGLRGGGSDEYQEVLRRFQPPDFSRHGVDCQLVPLASPIGKEGILGTFPGLERFHLRSRAGFPRERGLVHQPDRVVQQRQGAFCRTGRDPDAPDFHMPNGGRFEVGGMEVVPIGIQAVRFADMLGKIGIGSHFQPRHPVCQSFENVNRAAYRGKSHPCAKGNRIFPEYARKTFPVPVDEFGQGIPRGSRIDLRPSCPAPDQAEDFFRDGGPGFRYPGRGFRGFGKIGRSCRRVSFFSGWGIGVQWGHIRFPGMIPYLRSRANFRGSGGILPWVC